MSVTKGDIKSNITTAIDNVLGSSVSDSTVLSDTQQATALNAALDSIDDHCYIVNPNVKPTPKIKIR